eukprot:TRINITY_DN26565_c0_g2_i1.p1 TRINITY_DN26565_c0_g2~~TRINITY_DN26565_c0_g2_i1.p1  ORF type:complete len:174 (+),score=53.57 TRINITY_DN26565_c0_g2_i1:2-523(+)
MLDVVSLDVEEASYSAKIRGYQAHIDPGCAMIEDFTVKVKNKKGVKTLCSPSSRKCKKSFDLESIMNDSPEGLEMSVQVCDLRKSLKIAKVPRNKSSFDEGSPRRLDSSSGSGSSSGKQRYTKTSRVWQSKFKKPEYEVIHDTKDSDSGKQRYTRDSKVWQSRFKKPEYETKG